MDTVLLLGRLLIVGVLVVAGLAKLVDGAGAREALRSFGVRRSLTPLLALALPLAELAVAGLLVPSRTSRWAAVGALALFLLFAAAIAVNLVHGRRPQCRCFGQLSVGAVGWGTVGRNLALAVVAGGVVAADSARAGPSALAWLTGSTTTERIALTGVATAFAFFATMTWLVLQLLRQQGRILLRLDALEAAARTAAAPGAVTPAPARLASPAGGLPTGLPAPPFALADLDGRSHSLEELAARAASTLLLFMDPECGPCAALLPDVARWRSESPERLRLVIVSRGDARANREKFARRGLEPVLLQRDFEVATAYQAFGTPSAVVITPERTIGSPVAAGADSIRALVGRTLGHRLPMRPARGDVPRGNGHAPTPSGVPVGRPAPRFTLVGLDSRPGTLEAVRERPTIVLFWNPRCGFCQAMRSDVLAWEAAAPPGAPALLVVSSGAAEESRLEGFQGTVLVDPGFSAGQAFGARGTPSAVLLDQEGRVQSAVAVGGPAVLALLRRSGATVLR